MIRDYNMKEYKKNAFRQSKHRGEIASRVRVPGGKIDSQSLMRVVEIAEKYGNGTINITSRQGFEIPHIRIEDRDTGASAIYDVDAKRILRHRSTFICHEVM